MITTLSALPRAVHDLGVAVVRREDQRRVA